jgi:hypothetical protein
MDTITGLISWIFWTAIAVVSWILSKLFWIVLWLLLPFALFAFVALRVAEYTLGKAPVRGWLKTQSLKYGANAWVRTRRVTFALGALPFRVLGWLAVYAIWHSLISLLWTPRWTPWARAWAKRWHPGPPTSQAVKSRAYPKQL